VSLAPPIGALRQEEMMIQSSHGRARVGAITLAAALALTGCGGVTKFQDTTPISVSGPTPEPPPAPPPPPPAKPKRVEVKLDRIEITEKIQFELAKATILPESHSLLDEIVEVFRENAQIKKVNIVGHTSDEGADAYNQTLSEQRAQAVLAYLTSHGIAAGRLTAKGMGETQPLAENTTEAGREKNRRVEFLIVEQDTTKMMTPEEAKQHKEMTAAEKKKAEQDAKKAEAEAKKAEAERLRQEAADKKKAEAEAKKAEAEAKKAEAAAKRKAEADAKKAEAEAKKAEAEAKKKAEADAKKAEQDAKKAEQEAKKKAEADAKKAEQDAKKAEQEAKKAEADKKKAEADAKKAEADKKKADADAKKADADAKKPAGGTP
jgi:outer membrane protein OmpA-like peptidoglycan-associated protein